MKVPHREHLSPTLKLPKPLPGKHGLRRPTGRNTEI